MAVPDSYKPSDYILTLKRSACGYLYRMFPKRTFHQRAVALEQMVNGREHIFPTMNFKELMVVNDTYSIITQFNRGDLSDDDVMFLQQSVKEATDTMFFKEHKEEIWLHKQNAFKTQQYIEKSVRVAYQQQEEKKRLEAERKRFLQRRWYASNRERENAKRRQRHREKRDAQREAIKNARRSERRRRQRERERAQMAGQLACCPNKALGAEAPPVNGFSMWLTKCNTCQRMESCYVGFNSINQPGIYFRGIWFKEINPEEGSGVTMAEEKIDLHRIF